MAIADKTLTGRRVALAPFAREHLDDPAYLSWLRDYEVIKTLNLPDYWSPVPIERVRAYVEGLWASSQDMFFAITVVDGSIFAGTLRLARIDRRTKSADIGIMIGRRELWGKGLATEAIALALRHVFDDLGLRRATAGLMAGNIGMAKVFEKNGFVLEGRFREQDPTREGEYSDHLHYGCLRTDFEAARKRTT